MDAVEQIKALEHAGFWYEDADASLELLILRAIAAYQPPFEVVAYTVLAFVLAGRRLRLDEPPMAVSDPLTIAGLVDGILLVMVSGQTRSGELTRVI